MALIKQLTGLCFLILLTGTMVLSAEPQGLRVTQVTKTKVDAGMTIKGKWGTFINGKSYQQVPLDTHKGWQYTTYYDQKRRLSIARRKLPDGAWQVIHFNEVFHPVGSGPDSERNRAKILSTPDHDLVAMFNNKSQIVLVGATAEDEYRNWEVIHREDGPWNGEPLPDLTRWREEGILSIYMQKDPANMGEPTDLYTVDFSVSSTGKNSSSGRLHRRIKTLHDNAANRAR